jgi:hypothetical protein
MDPRFIAAMRRQYKSIANLLRHRRHVVRAFVERTYSPHYRKVYYARYSTLSPEDQVHYNCMHNFTRREFNSFVRAIFL